MKKIKKKKGASPAMPSFLIGWTHGDPPPPGYMTAWFDQAYGGPLRIRFLTSTGHHHFEAWHTSWNAEVQLAPPVDLVEQWQGRLHWDHSRIALLFAQSSSGMDRRNAALHAARVARGLTLLTDGTAYDVASGMYRNPSDWRDRELVAFHLDDHVQVEQQNHLPRAQTWFYTRGMTKFGLDEIETFLPIGLSGQDREDLVLKVAGQLIDQGANPKVGEQVILKDNGSTVTVIRHRTDPVFGIPLAFREFTTA